MRTVAVLGSTGSIGTQALEVIEDHPTRFEVVCLAAARSVERLVDQAHRFRPATVVVVDPEAAARVAPQLPAGTELVSGPEALAEVAACAEVVVNAVVGFAGLGVTLGAITAGRRLALANKESIVAGGPVVRAALERSCAEVVPVDSEHSALHQAIRSGASSEVARVLLTASGGPFRGRSPAELAHVEVDDALAHPTWAMGPKITVDSSTLMNKGLEVIEAHELFDVPYERIDVVVHPQSIVHSMVEFRDGSTIAQLSRPDMRMPISYALGHPDRGEVAYGRLDWTAPTSLAFEPPDWETFPCLGLAYEAGRIGGTAPAWLNAANEVAVEAFLQRRLAWTGISEVLQRVLARHDGGNADTVGDVMEADGAARAHARREIDRLPGRGEPAEHPRRGARKVR